MTVDRPGKTRKPREPRQIRWIELGIGTALLVVLFHLLNSTAIGAPTDLPSPPALVATQPTAPSPEQQVDLGRRHYQAGQVVQATILWRQAAAAFAARGDRLNQAIVLSNLALAYQDLGNWPGATQSITESQTLLQQWPDQTQVRAEALTIQGKLQYHQGDFEAALTTWQAATRLFQQADDRSGTLRSTINQAQALRMLGLYPRAKEQLEQAYQSIQTQPPSLLRAALLLNFGDALWSSGDNLLAQTVLQKSLDMAQTLNSAPDTTAALLSLGNLARFKEGPEAALTRYRQAADMAPGSGLKTRALLNQFHLLIELERWPEAQALVPQIQGQLGEMPPSRPAVYSRIHLIQGVLRLQERSGRPVLSAQSAAEILATAVQQAQALSDPRAESFALGSLGHLYERTQQAQEARNLTEQALILAQSSNAPDIAYRWQWQLGRLLKLQAVQAAQANGTQANYQEAIAAYEAAIQSLELIRKDLVSSNLDVQFSFQESVEPVYRQLVSLLLLNKADVNQSNLKQARTVIESLQLAELDNFFQEACLTARPQAVDQLDQTAAVIYPIILPDRLEVIVSLPDQRLTHYATAIAQADLEPVLERARQSLRRTGSSKTRLALAQQVYDWLIRPAEADLTVSGVKTLAFVLDGPFKNLPMASLHDGQRYLLETYRIAITPSLQLVEPRPLARRQLQLLIGGLSEARQGFASLPGVQAEVNEISATAPAAVMFNEGFTGKNLETQIRTTAFPVVHLATHGQFSSNADNTFILAWDQPITVKQLGALLQSRAERDANPIELLVLSACQTATGDRRAALGLAGIAVRSGARSTLATLWPVDDQSTSFFMVQFYQELAKPDVTRAEAVRRAQLALLNQPAFKHPFYWAPFILVGNWL